MWGKKVQISVGLDAILDLKAINTLFPSQHLNTFMNLMNNCYHSRMHAKYLRPDLLNGANSRETTIP